MHYVVVIPGLGDRTIGISFLTAHWRLFGLTPIIDVVGWNNQPFKPKLQELIVRIDSLAARGTVSIVGLSAGASAALNALMLRNNIHRVVSVCGLIRILDEIDRKDAKSSALLESVDFFKESVLSETSLQKVLTIRPRFGDERIKPENSTLEGAHTIEIPSRGHALSIGLALTVFSRSVISFLKQ